MPRMTGLELQAIMTGLGHPLPIVCLTANASVATSVSAMKAGARVESLTPREAEVFGYVSRGPMNKKMRS